MRKYAPLDYGYVVTLSRWRKQFESAMGYRNINADVAQLVELQFSKLVVAGSNPVIRSNAEFKGNPQSGGCPSAPCGSSSFGRAPRCQRGGSWFKPNFPLSKILSYGRAISRKSAKLSTLVTIQLRPLILALSSGG